MEISIGTAQDNLADATAHLRSFDRWVECDVDTENPPRSQAHEEALDRREAALADLHVALIPQIEADRLWRAIRDQIWWRNYENRMGYWRLCLKNNWPLQ